jgi:hypothetical protein
VEFRSRGGVRRGPGVRAGLIVRRGLSAGVLVRGVGVVIRRAGGGVVRCWVWDRPGGEVGSGEGVTVASPAAALGSAAGVSLARATASIA